MCVQVLTVNKKSRWTPPEMLKQKPTMDPEIRAILDKVEDQSEGFAAIASISLQHASCKVVIMKDNATDKKAAKTKGRASSGDEGAY